MGDTTKESVLQVEQTDRLDIPTIENDNYHGLTAKTVLVYAVCTDPTSLNNRH